MANHHLKADIGISGQGYHVLVSLIEFQEDNVTILYSPALDLTGYGYNLTEAKTSFEESLHEFLRYTTNKGTFEKALQSLGWTIKGSKKKPRYNPPKDSDMVKTNSTYNEIVNKKDYRVSRKNIELSI